MAKKQGATPTLAPGDRATSNGAFSGFEFTLDRQEKPVRIKDKRTGETVDYVLREAMGEQSALWRNWMLARAKMDPKTGKPSSFGQIAESEPYLVSLCLYKTTGKKDNVPFHEVKSWPNRIIKPLFNWIKDVSELDEGEDDEEGLAKNELEDTPVGS